MDGLDPLPADDALGPLIWTFAELEAKARLQARQRRWGRWTEDDDRAFNLAYAVFVLAEHDR